MGQATIPHWYAAESEVITLVEGDGVRVTDDAGTEYLDFLSQLYSVNAGHGQASIADAMAEQARRLAYVSPAKGNDTRSRLAERLAEVTPANLTHVQFSVSGSEANELAMQLARFCGDAPKILTRYRSYHGSTYGAGAMTGDPSTRTAVEAYAAVTGHVHVLPPLDFGGPFDADTPEALATQAADHLEWVIRNEGPDSIAAFVTEPIAGTSGAYTAPPGYFERVREVCDRHDILLVSDEVITGFGRCGEWFGIQTEGVEPDLLTFAKGATSSYAPLAGVAVSSEIAERVEAAGWPIGQTFAGHPVSCAAGNAALDLYAGGLIDNGRELASDLESGLRNVADEFDVIADVHGRGFLWSVEFGDRETGEFLFDPRTDEGDNPVVEVRERAQAAGVLFGSGRPDTQVILAPPLCATRDDIDAAVSVLHDSIEAVF